MSFQGDVGGIGLADLLQSLARGREGSLTLIGREGLRSTLGIQGGLVHLLPEPDEDPELWRARARQAWVKDPDFRIDTLRMTEIARAQRIENVYRLLDSDGVHFRFAPGPLPERPSDSALSQSEPGLARKGTRRDSIFCTGMPVEGLLLEYARLKDEAQSCGPSIFRSNDAVLCSLAAGASSQNVARFMEECDGLSNLVEIADRLGWPLRQLCIVAQVELYRGTLRLAQPHELLALAERELLQANFGRAASRLCAWCEGAPPGPPFVGDAEFFANEWLAGRLQSALKLMPARPSRTLLRRIDLALGNPLTAVEHWQELARVRRQDAIANVHLIACQVRSALDPNLPAMRDLLAMARGFSDNGQILRAGAVLRVAAARSPETTGARLEIGLGMLSAGLAGEAAPWILEAARTLIGDGQSEKAIAPLRALIDADTTNREARRQLARARAHSVHRTLIRKNSLVTLAVLLALSLGAFVQISSQRAFEHKLSEITSHLSEPRVALALLDQNFKDDVSARIQDLRASIEERRKAEDAAVRTAWTDRYREAQTECTLGDPSIGLQRALELPPPPSIGRTEEPWPLVSDLYNGLAARLESSLRDIGEAVVDAPEQLHAEQRVEGLVDLLEQILLKGHTDSPEARAFQARLSDTRKRLIARDEARARARTARLNQDNLARQDVLLGSARAHAQAGDHARALAVYQQLIETDATGKLEHLLAKEIKSVESKDAAVTKARELALAGQHAQASKVLAAAVENPRDYLLPWHLATFPSGARAHFKDGSVHVTPFVFESATGEQVVMTLELEGHEPIELAVDEPADRFLYFSRIPERWWKTDGRVEALPVAVGDDHVVCDRSGMLARISKNGTALWQKKLAALGGIGRAPVFLPRKPGFLLVLTEDGEAWIVEASTGAVDGPWSMRSPPIEGPIATEAGVRARFRDGTLAQWDSRLKPETITDDTIDSNLASEGRRSGEDAAQYGSSAGLAVLRRGSEDGRHLASPWTGWSIDIDEKIFSVRKADEKEPNFTVRRCGEWSYVAWEAPHTLIPRGRLWIADGKGLRSFQP